MDKKELRKLFREKRAGLSQQEVELKSAEICRKILSIPEYKKADGVLCYMAFRNEVNLKNIMLTSWESGKEIFLPRMDGRVMEFFRVNGEDSLTVNDIGIYEPGMNAESLTDRLAPGSFLLMIVPGLVFDRRGYRLGYGGGYYDRYLEAYSDIYDIRMAAAAFSLQITDEELPTEYYDIPTDLIVTEDYMIRTSGQGDRL